MSGKATFDGAPEQGTINFSVGQPSADLLPLPLLRAGCDRFFANAEPLELNYGERQGDARFREALAAFLNEAGGFAAAPGSLLLTAGISQALDFACARFTRPGDTVTASATLAKEHDGVAEYAVQCATQSGDVVIEGRASVAVSS